MNHFMRLRFHLVMEGLPRKAGDYLFLDKTSNPLQVLHVRTIFEKFDREGRRVYSYRDCEDGYRLDINYVQSFFKYWFEIPSTLMLKVIEDRDKEKSKKAGRASRLPTTGDNECADPVVPK